MPEFTPLAAQVVAAYMQNGKKIVTAESCTGGLIAAALTDVPGASAVFERGFVTYSPEAKTETLGVMTDVLERHGLVSPEVAEEMAQGALEFSRADIALAVTGVAGPTGGTPQSPVGTVIFGIATREGTRFHVRCAFSGPRATVRQHAVAEGLKILLATADQHTDL